jgi:tetratricopeptide (TPR) repeat protein
MKKGVILGACLIAIGIGLYVYYDQYIRYEREARELITEGKLVYERGTREAVNNAIGIFSKVIAKYRGTPSELEAYFYIARSYEKLKLNDYAYLKYSYILKSNRNIDPAMKNEIKARIARIKALRYRTDEGIHQLYDMLNHTENKDFKSRIYTELGYTYLQTGEYQKSKRMFDIAMIENGDNEEALLGKARAYKRLGNADMAYSLYEYFLKYYGNYSHYAADVRRSYIDQVYRSGIENFRRGNYNAAIPYFKKIVSHYPDIDKAENSLYWIGESYFSQGKYGTALGYFNRVMENENTRKDEDARIKKGFTYFLMKKFDLAAREFQIYINNYPRGRHIDTAKKWKSMSTQELLQRIQNRLIPDAEEEKSDGGKKEGGESSAKPSDKDSNTNNKAMSGTIEHQDVEDVEYENVGEL